MTDQTTTQSAAAPAREGATVQIFTGGGGPLVFVNGQRINDLLKVELPVKPNELGPQVVLTLWAKDVHHTSVIPAVWKRLQGSACREAPGCRTVTLPRSWQAKPFCRPGYEPRTPPI